MLSKLEEIISDIAEINEIKLENYVVEKIKLVEKHVDADGDIDSAISELDKILGFQWDKFFADIRDRLEKAKRK